jgi:hypothetical protein
VLYCMTFWQVIWIRLFELLPFKSERIRVGMVALDLLLNLAIGLLLIAFSIWSGLWMADAISKAQAR